MLPWGIVVFIRYPARPLSLPYAATTSRHAAASPLTVRSADAGPRPVTKQSATAMTIAASGRARIGNIGRIGIMWGGFGGSAGRPFAGDTWRTARECRDRVRRG